MANHDCTQNFGRHEILSICHKSDGTVGMAGRGFNVKQGDTLTIKEYGRVAKYEIMVFTPWAEWSDKWSVDAKFVEYVA